MDDLIYQRESNLVINQLMTYNPNYEDIDEVDKLSFLKW